MIGIVTPMPGELPDDSVSEINVDAELDRLSQLSPIDYDRERHEAAKRLGGIRTSTLDDEVQRRRGDRRDDDGAGSALVLDGPEPWHEPVDGSGLLNGIAEAVRHYIAMPDHAADVVALWAVHCHAFDTWRHTPRLNVTAPEKGCGKSTLLDVLVRLVPRPIKTENLSTAVLFRIVDQMQPTLLIDEVDTFLRDNEELRGCLNAGHARGGRHLRCDGDSNEVRAFRTFAPAALAGIGNLPATLADRSLTIILQRRRSDQVVADFRDDRAGRLGELASQAARWVGDNRLALSSTEPVPPSGIHNRLADNWRPLLAIAEVAGGDWPDRVRNAAMTMLHTAGDDTETIKVKLLSDIRAIFAGSGSDRLGSEDIVQRLQLIEDRPWAEYGRAFRPITKAQMARLLKPFGIAPATLRIDATTTVKGYRLDQFQGAFAAYLPSDP